MMKKILFFTFVGLLMALTSSGQTAWIHYNKRMIR